ncbi:MAG: hypothetical protein ACRD43_07010, partial [Pyrinomonadaceae bacterium]
MNGLGKDQELAMRDAPTNVVVEPLTNGRRVASMKDLPVLKQISDEQRIEGGELVAGKETEFAHRYRGIGGYLRLFEVTRVIAMLSMY